MRRVRKQREDTEGKDEQGMSLSTPREGKRGREGYGVCGLTACLAHPIPTSGHIHTQVTCRVMSCPRVP